MYALTLMHNLWKRLNNALTLGYNWVKMAKSKSVKYHSLSLPVDFIEIVKDFIEENQRYRSVAEFARYAMIEKMEREPDDMTDEQIERMLQRNYPHHSKERLKKIPVKKAKIVDVQPPKKQVVESEEKIKKWIREAVKEAMNKEK